MPDLLTPFDASLVAALFHLVLAPVAAIHALIYKRDSRAAFGWITLCVLLPIAGPVLYALLGVNRIQRRARRLALPRLTVGYERGRGFNTPRDLPVDSNLDEHHRQLAGIGDLLSEHELVDGNRVIPLINGEKAYPDMLEGIAGATSSVFLSSYILDSDRTGREFVAALGAAVARGVQVRVLIDGIGCFYSFPPVTRLLRRAGVPAALFLPPRLLPPRLSINLRNHHKLLIIDGKTAYTGGMNIGDRHRLDRQPARKAVADIHFRLTGPIAGQLQAEFLRDWEFSTGEKLDPVTPATQEPTGPAWCRTLTDGPDDNLDQIVLALNAIIGQARRSILIMTPYFLPPRELIGALQAAALRGVEVLLVLPEKSNLPYVHWATRNMLWELLYLNIRVVYQPPPFNHGKLLAVDDCYAQIGSSNWDPRSLRLNFELQVEIFNRQFARECAGWIRQAAERGREVTLQEVDSRGLPARLRDSFCWLFSPYL
ncbi:MAG: phospholipase D-like domain-containing protein, partial [Wenzhouxiangellaceae bacterium]